MEYSIPNSSWIWVSRPSVLSPDSANLVLFRKTFELTGARPCKLRISADTRYKLYCNGELISLGPAKGDRNVWYYDTADITPHLRPGVNCLSAQVLRYPARHNQGCHSLFRTETPGLYVEELYEGIREPVSQTVEDLARRGEGSGERIGLTADGSWKWHYVDGFSVTRESPGFAPLMFMEDVKADPTLHNWRSPAFDDSSWEQARPYAFYEMPTGIVPGNLLPRPIPPVYLESRRFKGMVRILQSGSPTEAWEAMLRGGGRITVPANSRETVEIDAGCEETGFLSLRLEGGAGAKIELLCSEAYGVKEGDGPFAPVIKKDRRDFAHGELYGFTDRYTVSGAGSEGSPEAIEPFWFRTFRFIRLTIEAGGSPLTLSGFDYQETGYPLEVRTTLETSDPGMAGIWDISERTLRRCMQETYTDCPFYEQLQYAMDSRSQILYTYMVSADDRLARNCMEDFRRSQRYDGLLNCSYPNYEPNIIPGFSIYYILMLFDHMMFFGDKGFLRGHLSCVDGILAFFDAHLDERGLVGKIGGVNGRSRYWSFIDWTDQWDRTSGVPAATLRGPIAMESLLYICGLQAASEILSYVGRGDVAREYLSRAEDVRNAVRRHCMGPDGMVADGPGIEEYSQHCQVFGLLTGTVPPDQARENLKRTLEAPGDYAQCSVAMAYYLFRALERAGLYQETGRLWDTWREMVKDNLTTCVEDGVRGRSDCHAWGSLALYELPAVVLGVRPGAPGFTKLELNPVPGHFTWAKGEVITPLGPVKVDWRLKNDGSMALSYEAPGAMQVELRER